MFQMNFLSKNQIKSNINNGISVFFTSYLMKILIFQIILLIILSFFVVKYSNDLKSISKETDSLKSKYNEVVTLKNKKKKMEKEIIDLKKRNRETRDFSENLCRLSDLTDGKVYFSSIHLEYFRNNYIYDITGIAEKMKDVTNYLVKVKNTDAFKLVELENMKRGEKIIDFSLKLVQVEKDEK